MPEQNHTTNTMLSLSHTGVAYKAMVQQLPKEERAEFSRIWNIWMQLQEEDMRAMGKLLSDVMRNIDYDDKKIKKRIESQDYLQLIKKVFRHWEEYSSEKKRDAIENFLYNAAIRKSTPDEVLFSFIDWIDTFSDAHLQVIKQIYIHPGSTRKQIWLAYHNDLPPENSAEADLFKLLIQDLSTGYIIRQSREKDYYGNTIRRKSTLSPYKATATTKAFDNTKKYQLTELGKQFALYILQKEQEVAQSLLS